MNNKDNYNQLLGNISSKEKKIPQDIPSSEKESDELVNLKYNSFKQYLALQRTWSWIIGGVLGVSCIAVWVMIFLLGKGAINLELYPWLPHTVMGTFFGEVVGLGLIVAKCLFPKYNP